MATPSTGRVRFAVLGLGHIAQVAVLPAFAHAHNAELVALVSGDARKRALLGSRYQVKHAVSYADLDPLLSSGEIDAVYIATPNHLHAAQTIAAARHGVHVLCEKPMAVTEGECEQMHRACKDAGVRLMVAYRLHFDEANLSAIALARTELGELRYFTSAFSQRVRPGNIRTDAIERGGGSLYDIGIYCINAARYLFRDEPSDVFAMLNTARDPQRGTIYDQTVGAVLRFPGGRFANISTSFDAHDGSTYRIVGTRGELRMEPAYSYAEGLSYTVSRDGESRTEHFPPRDQFAPVLIHFSDSILRGQQPGPDWREGLADVRIIRALHRSAREARPIPIAAVPEPNRPDLDQLITRPPVDKPEEIDASSPKRP